ncbi:MAG: DUF3108 domain-containing protein [Sedimenticolaceae bacterium]|nr:DUF3108 domain-containing protein [Sedimenticolaceae bacterium]
MRTILAILLLLASSLASAETFNYSIKFKGALTAFSWATLADGSIETRKVSSCLGRGSCLNTRVRMSSENHTLLESLYPTRFFYQSYFSEKPVPRTIAFEKREKKNKSEYKPYGYRHKLVTISSDGSQATFLELWSKGEPLSAAESKLVSTDHNGGQTPAVRKRKTSPVEKNALDRWAMIHTARFLPYNQGYSKRFPGTNGKDRMTYDVRLAGTETVEARGRKQEAWKVSIIETKNGKRQPTLFLWISQDEERIPLQVEMDESIGKLRFHLK